MPTIISPSHEIVSPTYMAQGGGLLDIAGDAFSYAQIIAALTRGGGSRAGANAAIAAISLLPGGGYFTAGVGIGRALKGKDRPRFTLPGVKQRGNKDPIIKSFALGIPDATLRRRREIPRAAERAQPAFDFAIGETRRRLGGLGLDDELNSFNTILTQIRKNYVGQKALGGLQAQFDLLAGTQKFISQSGLSTPEYDRQSMLRAFDYNKRDLVKLVAKNNIANAHIANWAGDDGVGPPKSLFTPETHSGGLHTDRLKGFQQEFFPTLNPFPNSNAQNVRAEFIAQGKPVPSDVQRDSDTINRLLERFSNLRVAKDVFDQDGGQLGRLGLSVGDTTAWDIVNPMGAAEKKLRTPTEPPSASGASGVKFLSQQRRGRGGVSGAANVSQARVLV